MSPIYKHVYMSPESDIVDKELITLKEKILYFERINKAGGSVDAKHTPKTMVSEIKPKDEKIVETNDMKTAGNEEDGRLSTGIKNYNADSGKRLGSKTGNKSRVQLLIEQLFERKNEELRDGKRMAEARQISGLGTRTDEITYTDKKTESKVFGSGDVMHTDKETCSETESNVSVLGSVMHTDKETCSEIESNVSVLGSVLHTGEESELNDQFITNKLYEENSSYTRREKNESEVHIKDNEDDSNIENQTIKNNITFKSDEDMMNDVISGDADSISFFNVEEFHTKLNAMIDEEIRKNDGIKTKSVNKIDQEIPVKQNDSTITQRCPRRIFESSASEDKLPNTFEILNDFSKFNLRPRMFACPEINPVDGVNSMNLFINCINREFSAVTANRTVVATPLFSKTHFRQIPVVFRAPGQVLPGRPKIAFSGSVVAEEGVLVYLRVFNDTSSWHIVKRASQLGKYGSEAELITRLVAMDNADYSKFVLSDIVTTVYTRTSYVYYDNSIVLLKVLGSSLCVCINNKCIKMIPLHKQKTDSHKINTEMGPGFAVANVVFGCSCDKERDEWCDIMTALCV